jgi:hypothetical protein
MAFVTPIVCKSCSRVCLHEILREASAHSLPLSATQLHVMLRTRDGGGANKVATDTNISML